VLWAARLALALPAAGASASSVVELFTSQGCYSCPPADELLGELATRRSDVIALEFHVDYWDNLVYGSAGSWSDPFSKAAYSDRQRGYHRSGLDGRRGVYTPQAVVNGRYATVGTDRRRLLDALADAETTPFLDVAVTAGAAGISISVAAREGASGDVWLVRFDRRHVTEVPAGENNGKTLANHHVVTALSRIGEFRGAPVTVEAPLALGADEHCAVLVQRPAGPILGAAYCP